MRRTNLQFVRFLFAGLLNTAFGYAVFVVLLWVGLGSLPALVLATLSGIVFNFQTSRRLVFSGQPGAFLRFALVYGLMLLVNWAALSTLQGLGLKAWLAQAILTLPLALLSFGAQKMAVFGRAQTA